MDRIAQQAKLDEVIMLASDGNRDAEAYMRLVAQCARWMDDIVDGDVDPKPDVIDLAELLFVHLPANAFFRANASWLIPLHWTAINAWRDSNVWEKADGAQFIYSRVIRDQINEITQMVALLTGGPVFAKRVSLTIREAFLKDEFKKE